MASAAVASVASMQCGGRLPVGVVDADGGSGAYHGSTGASGTASGVTGSATNTGGGSGTVETTGSYASGSFGYSGEYFDATASTPGDNDAAPSITEDSAASMPTSADVACWENQLPPEPQPIQPTATVSAICEGYPGITQWSPLVADAGVMNDADGRAAIVGRWVTCSGGAGSAGAGSSSLATDTSTFSLDPHVGIEFGGNGRWRLLVADSSGAVVPTTATDVYAQGRYYALATGQLDLRDNGFAYLTTMFLKLSPDGNTLEITPTTAPGLPAYYARATPAANNGDDNVPSTTSGACSMVGTWDLAMTSQSPAATFSFDALGNFVGGPLGADLCTSHTMYGTYRLSPEFFQLTENIDMGACAWWFDAGYPAMFDATCTHLILDQEYDNCTGGRGYFNGTPMLTKRQ